MASYVLITVVPEKICIAVDPSARAKRNVQERKAHNKVTKSCFVPYCTNTSHNSKKLFLIVPRDKRRRQNWMQAVKKPKNSMSMLYCCEDHFNLEEDAANWMFFKTMGSNLQMKKEVVPHKNMHPKFISDPYSSQLSLDEQKRRQLNQENLKKSSFDETSSDEGKITEDETTELNEEEKIHNFEFVEMPDSLNNIKLINIENIKMEPEENSFQEMNIKSEITIDEMSICQTIALSEEGSVLKSLLECSSSVESSEYCDGSVPKVKIEDLGEIDSMECVPNAYLELEYNLGENS